MLHLLVRDMPVVLLTLLDTLVGALTVSDLQELLALADDTAASVRREVCISLVLLLSILLPRAPRHLTTPLPFLLDLTLPNPCLPHSSAATWPPLPARVP